MENTNYQNIGIVPQEIKLRDILGVSLEKDSLATDFVATVEKLLTSQDFKQRLQTEREAYFYNLGTQGSEGAKYIVQRLINKKK